MDRPYIVFESHNDDMTFNSPWHLSHPPKPILARLYKKIHRFPNDLVMYTSIITAYRIIEIMGL